MSVLIPFSRPGDYLKDGEDESSVLPAKLDEKLSPPGVKTAWDIEPECLGTWYRPNFDNPVVTKQEEEKEADIDF
jgi:hypothetical protein